jgi:hypothetical protein
VKTFCRIILFVWLALLFLQMLQGDFNGVSHAEPVGWKEAWFTFILAAIFVSLLWGGGMFANW